MITWQLTCVLLRKSLAMAWPEILGYSYGSAQLGLSGCEPETRSSRLHAGAESTVAVLVAHAGQGNTLFSAIPGYLEATWGFAQLQPAVLAAPTASQLDAPNPPNVHSDKTRLVGGNCTISQSQRNHRQRCIRHCRKLSLGSTDSGIDLEIDVAGGNWQLNTDDAMRVGKVVPMLTMGHGCPPAQALAEPAMPGIQVIQHMAPMSVLAHHPGDPPLVGEQGSPPHCQLSVAQIKQWCHWHQRYAQRQREARWINEPIGDQLEAMRPTCVCCGAKLWLPGWLNGQMDHVLFLFSVL